MEKKKEESKLQILGKQTLLEWFMSQLIIIVQSIGVFFQPDNVNME